MRTEGGLFIPGRPDREKTASKLVAARFAVSAREAAVAQKNGTAVKAGLVPLEWHPYYSAEASIGTRVVEAIHTAAMLAKVEGVNEGDLPLLLLARTFFYPHFGKFHESDDSVARQKMQEAGVFEANDFLMIPELISAGISKPSDDAEFKVKEIDPDDQFAVQKAMAADGLNNMAGLPEALILLPLLIVDRHIDQAREGENPPAMLTREGNVPSSLSEVMAEGTTYDSEIVKGRMDAYEEYFFGENVGWDPRLPITRQVLPHHKANRTFFLDHKDSWMDNGPAVMLKDSAEFVVSQGSRLVAAHLIASNRL